MTTIPVKAPLSCHVTDHMTATPPQRVGGGRCDGVVGDERRQSRRSRRIA